MNDTTLNRRGLFKGGIAAGLSMGLPSYSRAQSGQQKLVFAGWSHTEAGSKALLEGQFKDFRASHPSVDLETVGVPFGQMLTTLRLRRRGNQRTDIAQLQERWLPTVAAGGGLVDVESIFDRTEIEKTFNPTALAMTVVGNKRMALPWITGSSLLVGNGKVLADAGITQAPVTVDELLDALRKVKKAKPNSSPFGFTTKDPGLTQFESQFFFWTFGAQFFNAEGKVAIDSDPAVAALSLLATMVKEGLILPGNDRFDFRRLYAQGLVAFYPDPPLARAFARAQSGQGEAYDKNVLPTAMPVLKRGDQPVAIQWGHLFGFFDIGGAKPMAQGPVGQLFTFLTNTENQVAYYRATGVFPSTNAAIAALSDDAYLTRWIQLSNGARPDELARFLNGSELSSTLAI